MDGTGHSDAGLLGSVPSHDDLEKAKESEHKPWMTPRIMNAINARQEAYISDHSKSLYIVTKNGPTPGQK